MTFGLGADARRVLEHGISAMMVDRYAGFVDTHA
jgi:hypothetical protein